MIWWASIRCENGLIDTAKDWRWPRVHRQGEDQPRPLERTVSTRLRLLAGASVPGRPSRGVVRGRDRRRWSGNGRNEDSVISDHFFTKNVFVIIFHEKNVFLFFYSVSLVLCHSSIRPLVYCYNLTSYLCLVAYDKPVHDMTRQNTIRCDAKYSTCARKPTSNQFSLQRSK